MNDNEIESKLDIKKIEQAASNWLVSAGYDSIYTMPMDNVSRFHMIEAYKAGVMFVLFSLLNEALDLLISETCPPAPK